MLGLVQSSSDDDIEILSAPNPKPITEKIKEALSIRSNKHTTFKRDSDIEIRHLWNPLIDEFGSQLESEFFSSPVYSPCIFFPLFAPVSPAISFPFFLFIFNLHTATVNIFISNISGSVLVLLLVEKETQYV